MLGIYLAAIESEEDRATFAKIYTMYGEKMFKYALDLLKTSKEDAEDALHESFCRHFRWTNQFPFLHFCLEA